MMKTKEPLAFQLKRSKYDGPNPFTYSQARDYPRSKIDGEFFPTSKYWSLFNVSNEILIGTRGSGKTILLRMLAYSSYRTMFNGIHSHRANEIKDREGIEFIGFYVPLRLRVLREIGETSDLVEERRRFSFLFNCVCAGSILNELRVLVKDRFPDLKDAMLKERILIDKLKVAWAFPKEMTTSSFGDLQEHIDRCYDKVRMTWEVGSIGKAFESSLLEPIISILPMIAEVLNLSRENVTWLACFDEAEYLNENLQRVFNTVMRSESRGLALKIATLPLHYTEFQTEVDGENVQPDGDDFRFESIDYDWDETDYILLTDNLVKSRLSETRLYTDIPLDGGLNDFMGEFAHKDLISIYRVEFPRVSEAELTEKIEIEIVNKSSDPTRKVSQGNFKKFKPLFLLREIYKKNRSGNTKVAWLAGATMTRKVTGGNVRKFIQICDILFERSRKSYLRGNQQHESVLAFAERNVARSKSVYQEGFLLEELIKVIASYLHGQMHGDPIKDIGTEFTVSKELLESRKMADAVRLGVAYSYFTCEKPDLFYGITPDTKLRLSNAIAAVNWIPMRAGMGIKISAGAGIGEFLVKSDILPQNKTKEMAEGLELGLFDE